jgi:hypothetical protein
MASTYSTNLALELIGTGDQAGTWGNTTNTNLGTLVEQAISGYETQALTSGVTLTLTIPNGATGVARNMYLEFTGNGSTVIVPSNKKLYFVYNNCSSGTITMKVAGQTGVAVPKGSKQILVSNGTDIVEATTYISTATSATNGQLLIGNGSGLSLATLTAGTNVTITNGAGSITISASSVIGTTGSSNTTYGVAAGDSFTSATQNVAVGVDALTAATSASAATAVGYGALLGNTTGNGYNTAIGWQAGKNATTSDTCTFVGAESGWGITSAKIESTFLGFDAGITGNFSGITCLGAGAVCINNNELQLGDTNTTSYSYGDVVPRASDIRDKADVQNTNLGLNFIMALRPVMYRWDYREDYRPPKPAVDAPKAEWDAWHEASKLANLTHDGTHKRNRLHQGLIAQEVKAVMDAMGTDFGGYQDFKITGGDDRVTLRYGEFIAPLIKAIQELKAEFDEYKRTHP